MIRPDVAFPLFVGLLTLAIVAVWRVMGKRPDELLCLALFATYLFLVFDYAFLPLPIDSSFVHAMRGGPSRFSDVNLVPLSGYDAAQAMGNTLLGVPWGFGIMFVSGLSPKAVMGSALLFGFGIELGQLLVNLLYGFGYRSVDISDALLNAVGVALGPGLFLLVANLYVRGFADSGFARSLGRIDQVLTRRIGA